MCIIVAKNKTAPLPTYEQLENCFRNNSDGAGLMYVNKNNKIEIEKGFMTYESFKRRFDKLCKIYDNFKNKSLVMHFRIGTSSKNSPQNTHPYPISRKEKLMHKTHLITDIGIAHNGIISDYTPSSKEATMNDTQFFIQNYLTPLYENFPKFYENSFIMKGIQKVTNSKFAILTTDDKIYTIGEFKNDKNLLFSNDTYSYSWYNDYSKYYDEYYNERYSHRYDFLPSDASIIMSDGTQIPVGNSKLTCTYEGLLYEWRKDTNGIYTSSLIDTDCIAVDKYGEVIY